MDNRFLAILAAGLLGPMAAEATPYNLLLERDTDSAAGTELFAVSYNSYADFLDNTVASSAFSAININSSFSAGGFAFDGNQYHLLLERDTDSAAGTELFAVSYNSYADFLDNTVASSAFSAININSSFSAGGFASDWSPAATVPEPGTLLLMSIGVVSIGCRQLKQIRTA
jgi:hypothetical protein